MSDTKLLNVYKASAGSGKTYQLVINYIKLLIDNPKNYKHILAVTFTNKATAEMKGRILDNLNLIANTKTTLSEQEMRHRNGLIENVIKANPSRKVEDVVNACRQARDYILNDYSQFNISTIDSFEQKIVRAFACEAQLSASYSVELESELILSHAVDEIMSSLANNPEMHDWIMKLVEENIENNGKWEIEKQLLVLAQRVLFDTNHFGAFEHLDLAQLQDFYNLLKQIVKECRDTVAKEIEKLKNFVTANNLMDSALYFKGKNSQVYNILANPNNTFDKIFDSYFVEKNGVELALGKKQILQGDNPLENTIREILTSFNEYIKQKIRKFNTANLLIDNIYNFGIIINIRQKINEISQRERVMLIDETPRILKDLIDGSTLPFIYEKVGTEIHHMMIDEFQDTSRLQWKNFEPLVQNCVDTYSESPNEAPHESLIVGDVKQAIYRWRNSDWQLLDTIADPKNSKFAATLNVCNLVHNRRSLRNIVEFNNAVFSENAILSAVAQSLTNLTGDGAELDTLKRIYSTVWQESIGHSGQEGFVRIKFTRTPAANNKNSIDDEQNDESYETLVIDDVVEQIKLLKQKGYQNNDICILIRKNNDAKNLIPMLLQNNIPVISSDALLVCSSRAVQVIINYYRFLHNPHNEQALAYIVSICNPEINLCNSGWDEVRKKTQFEVLKLKGLGLVELTQAVVKRLPANLRNEQNIYIEAFTDYVRNLVMSRYVSLAELLEDIDQKSGKLRLTAPDNQDAVTIMTIHKSKGLESKVILIPYADWKVNKMNNSMIWVELPKPFDLINSYPVKYSKKLIDTYAAKYYYNENRMNAIDNLNLLYVAQTRAREVLMMWANCPFAQKEDKNQIPEFNSNAVISRFLYSALNNTEFGHNERCNYEMQFEENGDELVFSKGEIPTPKHDAKQNSYVIKPYVVEETKIYCRSRRENFEEERLSGINFGNKMHAVMERIKTIDDIDRAVTMSQLDGEFTEEEANKIRVDLHKRLTDSRLASLFDGSAQNVYTEDTILLADEELRPDRIVVFDDNRAVVLDYKFGKPNKKYNEQVSRYMSLLRQSGFEKVEGLIWYYNSDEIEKITD